MKAATTQGFGPYSSFVIKDVTRPKVATKDVLVEVYASSVNPKDWKLNQKVSSVIPPLGCLKNTHIIGDDLAGIVVDKGEQVTGFDIGDEVYGMDMNLRTAACAEYAKISQRCIAHKPATLSFSEAASVPLAALTALQAFYIGKLSEGSRVLIVGASGGVGTFAVQIARAMGAKVTAVCSGKNAELVTSLGAAKVIDYTTHDYLKEENDFDMIFDATSFEGLASCSSLMKDDGVFVTTVGHGKAFFDLFKAQLSQGDQKARSVFVQSRTKDLETLTHFIDEGKVKPVLDSQYPLAKIDDAFTRSKTGRARGKIVINIK
ncbi:MAG: NAD(P)-dependent alcohol dehydrogenase [Gammaproteobacteria bacterium]|nr:MAG: NAD(P)-dependent alcohol dehydrogenase [Gammaproteobacteria bacterium]